MITLHRITARCQCPAMSRCTTSAQSHGVRQPPTHTLGSRPYKPVHSLTCSHPGLYVRDLTIVGRDVGAPPPRVLAVLLHTQEEELGRGPDPSPLWLPPLSTLEVTSQLRLRCRMRGVVSSNHTHLLWGVVNTSRLPHPLKGLVQFHHSSKPPRGGGRGIKCVTTPTRGRTVPAGLSIGSVKTWR